MAEQNAQANKVALSSFYAIKSGMTRIFDKSGNHVPVTVLKLVPNFVSQIKTKEKDGYEAYQIAYHEKREKLINNPAKGHLKKASVNKNLVRFAEVKGDEIALENLGKEVSLDKFQDTQFIDVTGTTKGKGFQGFIKRYGFSGGPASHGSHFHRRGGSIGCRATPGHVFKQKKMPGHMGDKKNTVQNLQIVELNTVEGYLLVKGSIPGSKNSFVRVAKARKK